MKLRQMQCLCAVVDAQFNISRAATQLHATQPAVGKQLRQFEDEIGTELLLRHAGRPLALTQAGEQVLEWSRRALQCADNIRAIGEETRDASQGSIVLATTHTHARYVLLPAIQAFTVRHPSVQLNLLQGTPEGVCELLLQGQAGLGVTSLPAHVPPGLVAIPVLSASHVVVAPTGHPVLRMKDLTLEKLARYPVIMQHPTRPQGARIAAKFHDAGIAVHFAVQALDTDVMKTYVGAGLGIAIIPAFAYSARLDHGLRARDVGHLFDPTSTVVVLRRGAFIQRHVHAFLRDLAPSLERGRVDAAVFDKAE